MKPLYIHRKQPRNRSLIKFKAHHPCITFQHLGNIYKISRQRAHAILKAGEI